MMPERLLKASLVLRGKHTLNSVLNPNHDN